MGSNKPVLQAVSGIGINWISAVGGFFSPCSVIPMQCMKFLSMTFKLESDAVHAQKLIGPVFFEDTRCVNSDTVSWRIYIRKNARLLRGESHGSHSRLPGECPRRGIWRVVGNSRIVASTKRRFEFMRLFFVGVTERLSFVNCPYC